MTQFSNPWAFALLILIPAVLFLCYRSNKAAVRFSSKAFFDGCGIGRRVRLRPVTIAVRVLCIVLIIVAIARPRQGTKLSNVSTEGVAMQIVVDRSSSMNEQMAYRGKTLTRFDVVKLVLEDFIKGDGKTLKGRAGDMIGLVTFARYPDTLCPVVHNHGILLDFMRQSETVKIQAEDGTAIGEAIQLAAARLDQTEKQIIENNSKLADSAAGKLFKPEFVIKSKIMILLTDGINNCGDITPEQAAKLARDWGIKIYAIGIGSDSYQYFAGMKIPVQSQLDERMLSAIAQATGGFYARADSAETLEKIYEKIDSLEKTTIQAVDYYEYAEKFEPFIIAALLLLVMEIILNCTIFRKLP